MTRKVGESLVVGEENTTVNILEVVEQNIVRIRVTTNASDDGLDPAGVPAKPRSPRGTLSVAVDPPAS